MNLVVLVKHTRWHNGTVNGSAIINNINALKQQYETAFSVMAPQQQAQGSQQWKYKN